MVKVMSAATTTSKVRQSVLSTQVYNRSRIARRVDCKQCRGLTKLVFIQERLVSIVENDGCETDGKCEVDGPVQENAGTR